MKHWIFGLVSAAISGAASSFLTLNVVPGVFSDHGWTVYLNTAVVGSLVAAANYLARSPLADTEKPSDEK